MDTFTKSSGNCVNAGGAARPPRWLFEQLSDRIYAKHYSVARPMAATQKGVASRCRRIEFSRTISSTLRRR
ncbi:MAG: hypothetical protein CAPSK01_000047 [Candidatus Accumulibacter vicinus]|uniref:Uncharacterized protein n=1 Tax=Candidatus Accumulibacter vicinus TaxID=2954382 RepID=A0A084Y668_9PROT|nr:MAG: hypothetical protein CAPSK01_000047 [Candidatus Accumulibacter vicinus]